MTTGGLGVLRLPQRGPPLTGGFKFDRTRLGPAFRVICAEFPDGPPLPTAAESGGTARRAGTSESATRIIRL